MRSRVERYLDEYTNLLYQIEVTDGNGRLITFPVGVECAINMLRKITSNGGKIMLIGNGGSAAIASHFALDFWHADKNAFNRIQ